MARFSDDKDADNPCLALGEALARLRHERGLSQAEAGKRINITGQGWGLYEAGKRNGIFRPDVQRRLTSALSATPEDLALLVSEARSSAPSTKPTIQAEDPSLTVSDRGRSFTAPPDLERQHYRLDTDDLSPWASAGTVLEYVPGRWPRRDQGCVITLADGSVKARLYVRSDDREVVVRGAGALLTLEKIARSQIASISAVVARLDE